jgi:hypothetical protein
MFIDYVAILREINFHKIFKGKKIGDTFDFKIRIVYSIDDGPEIIQTIVYHVLVYKDTLRLPVFFGR